MGHQIQSTQVDTALVDKSNMITEAAIAIMTNGGLNKDGLQKSRSELELIGINIEDPKTYLKYMDLSSEKGSMVSLATVQPTDSAIGINTFELSNQLIQDASPEASFENSPYNTMMPVRNVNAVQFQQDIMESFHGWADGDNGYAGGLNPVPMLETVSNGYKGYTTSEVSFLSGTALYELRESGSSDATRRAAMQKLNYQTLLLLHRMSAGVELNRIESLFKGSWTWAGGNGANPVTINMGIPTSNVSVFSATGGLGSYSLANNKFTPNTSLNTNVLIQMGAYATLLRNMGLELAGIIMDNIMYNTIFNSQPITTQTQYVSMNSDNNVMGIRSNLFKLTTIPSLQDVPLIVDNRSIKVDGIQTAIPNYLSNPTTTQNTRPLLWGKTISSSSFRALYLVRPKGLTKIGELAFFPHIYQRTSNIIGGNKSNTGMGGNITMVTQDLSQVDILNQKVQMLAACNNAPIIYTPNLVFPFDFNVNVA